MEINEPKIAYVATGNNIEEHKYRRNHYLFPFNLTAGRIAESLIQELFLMEEYQTYKYGLENTYQYLYKKLKYNNAKAAKSLRKSPDLILYNPESEKVNYAEIKYRSGECFRFNEKDYPNYEDAYPDTYFFITNPANFFCISFPEMRTLKKLEFDNPENSKFLLKNSKEFNLRSKSIEHFELFLKAFYNEEFLKKSAQINGSFRN